MAPARAVLIVPPVTPAAVIWPRPILFHSEIVKAASAETTQATTQANTPRGSSAGIGITNRGASAISVPTNGAIARSTISRTKPALVCGYDFSITYELGFEMNLRRNLELDEPQPAFYWNTMTRHANWDRFRLSAVAQKVLDSPNAGGNSIVSEAVSAEILHRLYRAHDIKTEMEIEYYYHNWKIADFLIRIGKKNVGVSVTRCMSFPDPNGLTMKDARDLLKKKINGLVLARNAISEKDSFYTSVLHIFCQRKRNVYILQKAWKSLPKSLKDNVIVICTIAEDAEFVFRNYTPPKKSKQPICTVA